ncbi:MAG: transposase [Planctomycetes bacterium]|jgi:REP element-mobilizing transposase RayT|nr:transposase [Planctomycetota bacterium]
MCEPRESGRRSIRLHGYDYRVPGPYFITMCAHDRSCLFGGSVDGAIALNDSGRIVDECWRDLPRHYANVVLDEYCIMPNHVHAIIVLMDEPISAPVAWTDRRPVPDEMPVGAGLRAGMCRGGSETRPYSPTRHGLSEIVRAWKSFSARRINARRGTPGRPVWQRNYFERIVRDEREMADVRHYVRTNPERWTSDGENPERAGDPDPLPW